MNSRVIFLDYDGVVNTPMWNEKGTKCTYNFPKDGKVNNFQAVQWISECCKRFHFDIVVISTWRFDANYKECLINGGLREGIEILGRTDELSTEPWQIQRGKEVEKYLNEHPEIRFWMIIDDCDEFLPSQKNHFIQPEDSTGFGLKEFQQFEQIFMKDLGHQSSFWE